MKHFTDSIRYARTTDSNELKGRECLYNAVQAVLEKYDLRSSVNDESDPVRIHDCFKILMGDHGYSFTSVASIELDGCKPKDSKKGVLKEEPFGATLYRWMEQMKQEPEIVIIGSTFIDFEYARLDTQATKKTNKRKANGKKKTTDDTVRDGLTLLAESGALAGDLESVYHTVIDQVLEHVAKTKRDKVEQIMRAGLSAMLDCLTVDVD